MFRASQLLWYFDLVSQLNLLPLFSLLIRHVIQLLIRFHGAYLKVVAVKHFVDVPVERPLLHEKLVVEVGSVLGEDADVAAFTGVFSKSFPDNFFVLGVRKSFK